LVAGSIPAAGTSFWKLVVVAACVLLGGCSVGMVFSNDPSTMSACAPPNTGPRCR
jgi:hypothetical protein